MLGVEGQQGKQTWSVWCGCLGVSKRWGFVKLVIDGEWVMSCVAQVALECHSSAT